MTGPQELGPRRGLLRFTEVIGDRVRNRAGEDLGAIEDVVFDAETGRIVYAVVAYGGLSGVGSRLIAVPWGAFSVAPIAGPVGPGPRTFVLDLNRERLESAPGFERDQWPDITDRDWSSSIHDYYGLKLYWEE